MVSGKQLRLSEGIESEIGSLNMKKEGNTTRLHRVWYRSFFLFLRGFPL